MAKWFEWGQARLADFFLRPPTLTSSNFEALWHTDLISIVLKYLNLLKKYIKNRKPSCIFRINFACSKWPHFPRAYLVTVCKRGTMDVHILFLSKLEMILKLCMCIERCNFFHYLKLLMPSIINDIINGGRKENLN